MRLQNSNKINLSLQAKYYTCCRWLHPWCCVNFLSLGQRALQASTTCLRQNTLGNLFGACEPSNVLPLFDGHTSFFRIILAEKVASLDCNLLCASPSKPNKHSFRLKRAWTILHFTL